MSNTAAESTKEELKSKLFERLRDSEQMQSYKDAFRSATGLPLRLKSFDPSDWGLRSHHRNQSEFCERINACEEACQACRECNVDLMKRSEVEGPSSCKCFAGMMATAIPVYLGPQVIAYLKTGQVFQRTPTEADFNETLGKFGKNPFNEEETAKLRETYLQTQAIDPERYNSIVQLLGHFAKELTRLADELAVASSNSEPQAITRARKFIHSNLDQVLHLATVAREAGMSESHFCRKFKDATGMTFTNYVNYARIMWAKKELLKPNARISEVAYQVGFQSLSQFNRSFSKLMEMSPSAYRQENIKKEA
ncbi:helix-turn-helix domain-containing protein [Persicirhabdus sediminis]|uniref:PocR ligand-binding domain-containing protein n=1 Tax=Persicirhabdus sediminis TaxID=454144 RepID=A0A8J7MET1_9BACT|nr:helix-turn-helix domain-containing protein [Persicirhabdus sediminis]MBK1792006.1 PocR ligand-binding domain-containing protein [Persicirhabdus sediminis]